MRYLKEDDVCMLFEALSAVGLPTTLAPDGFIGALVVQRKPGAMIPLNPDGTFYAYCDGPELFRWQRVARDSSGKLFPLNSAFVASIKTTNGNGARIDVGITA